MTRTNSEILEDERRINSRIFGRAKTLICYRCGENEANNWWICKACTKAIEYYRADKAVTRGNIQL